MEKDSRNHTIIQCKECISLAICRNTPGITELLPKCPHLVNNIDSRESLIKVIEVLNPLWYGSKRIVSNEEREFNLKSIMRSVSDIKMGIKEVKWW